MIAIIDCGSSKVPYIEECIDTEMDFVTFQWDQIDLEKLNSCKGVVISGAPKLVTEIDLSPYLKAFSWIKETQLPVLGICFGHQIIGLLHGANAGKMKEDRDWQEIEFYKDHPLINKLPKTLKMMEDHCEAISIPSGFELIAGSDACVNEGMEHKSKPLFGVQFHPEVSGNHGLVLLQNFISYCLKDKNNNDL